MLDPDFTLDVELARRVNRILFRYTQSTAQLEDGTWRGPVGGILSDDCTTLEFTCGREFPQMGMRTFKFEKKGKESWVETVKHALRHWPQPFPARQVSFTTTTKKGACSPCGS